jgi:serine/threonine-protein kinase
MDALFREGDVLAGKYKIERVIRQGGMGIVVAAQHLQLPIKVALKFLLPSASLAPEAVARFLREARAASLIQSDHVVRVTDVGSLESGMPYMVMELLQGADLGEILESRGPLPRPVAVDCVLQACEAVAEAHKLGIVHRDLKPSNLFLTQRANGAPLLKVLDFGISKAIARSDGKSSANTTATTAFLGSPAYMSPEQVRSAKHVDGRTDIWALGVVLHELLTGAPVYQAESVSALAAMILRDPPKPVRQLRPEIPVRLENIILRCLEKDRERRYASASELAAALAPFSSATFNQTVEREGRGVEQRRKTLFLGAIAVGVGAVSLMVALLVEGSRRVVAAEAGLVAVTAMATAVGLAMGRWRGPRPAQAANLALAWPLELFRGGEARAPDVLSSQPTPFASSSSVPVVSDQRDEPALTADGHPLFRFLSRAPVMVKEERTRLVALALALTRRPVVKITIVGYADEPGMDAAAVGLAQYRAKVAQALLAKAGVSEDRLTLAVEDIGSNSYLARSVRVIATEPLPQAGPKARAE